MRKKVCYTEDGIVIAFSNDDINVGSVCKSYNTVNCKWDSNPLILSDSTVIVCLEVCKSLVFIKRMLL